MSVEEVEQLRCKAVKSFYISLGIYLLFMFLIIFVFKIAMIQLIFFLGIFGIVIVSIFTSVKYKKFVNEYKKVIVANSFKEVFTDVNYEIDRGISHAVINSTGMMRMGNRFYSNDYVSGKYKNIKFECSDVVIQNETKDSDGDSHTTTYFSGQWFIFDFNKKFKANFQVRESSFINARLGSIFDNSRYEKVELEDMEFNKKFDVYAQNPLDVFYVLTPATMEKIKELENNSNGHLLFCFIDNKLHVALYNNKDLFEPKLFKKINYEEDKKATLEEMKLITQFVDVLDLDNNLFRREV